MRRIVELSVVVLAIAVLIVSSSAQLPSFRSITSHGEIRWLPWLHVDGVWIKDEAGRRVQLRGSGGNYQAYGRIDTWFMDYVNWMKQSGCNCIRLAFNVPDTYGSPIDFGVMDRILGILEENGIYAVLDCHHYWDDMMANSPQLWIDCWSQIADRYKDRSMIAMYELLNEPYGSGGEELRNVYYECIDAIRATGDNHIVCLSVPERTFLYEVTPVHYREHTWYDPAQVPPNACINVHNWHGYNPDQWIGGNQSRNLVMGRRVASEWIATALAYRAKLGCPIVLGEFGTYTYDFDHANIEAMKRKIELAEEYGLPWWTWMLDHWMQDNYPYKPDFWMRFVNEKLGGPFTSNFVPDSVPYDQPFVYNEYPAEPFNIWTRIDEAISQRTRDRGYNIWGVGWIQIPQNYPVYFFGPCKLRVSIWGAGGPFWRDTYPTKEYYIDLKEGETWSLGSLENPIEATTVVWAASPLEV